MFCFKIPKFLKRVSNKKLLKIINHLENKMVTIEMIINRNNEIFYSQLNKIYFENELVKTHFRLLEMINELNEEINSLKRQINERLQSIDKLLEVK